jgi:hypothetical protein
MARQRASSGSSDRVGDDLWVIEAVLDYPVQIQLQADAPPSTICLSMGGQSPDGFVQLRPQDARRSTQPTFCAESDPVLVECRGLVLAPDSMAALLKAADLFEHVADRLTLLSGYPTRVVNVGFAYNEAELRRCVAGELSEFEGTTGGKATFKTQPPKNMALSGLLSAPPSAHEGIRWFRQGLAARRHVDQFLFYYISLECIAEAVPGIARNRKRNAKGEEQDALESTFNALVRHLIGRHTGLPRNTRQELARIRGKVAHGGADVQALRAASQTLPVIQRLAADAIALACGVDPTSFKVLEPPAFDVVIPLLRCHYSSEDNPSSRWGGLLSDVFAKCKDALARQLQDQ